MNTPSQRTGRWLYQGVWGVLVKWLRVPDTPPELPTAAGEHVEVFRPAVGFLNYMKLAFWIEMALTALAFFVIWLMITVAVWPVGLILFAPGVALLVFINVVFYVALHLRYDTTWYVVTGRSLRIRRGIWVIHETTITYDNIQNLRVSQGPVERYFGIANLLVETAGGGGGGQDPHSAGLNLNRGRIEGVDNAQQIRDLISARLRLTSGTGLGDDDDDDRPRRSAHRAQKSAHDVAPEQLALLREIRDAAQRLEAVGHR
ncbi:MAG: PH domain-containing protein [Planctomycetales bacterium]|nr:PH domain-containing protein [Planctomycetales bacterium]